jgi:phosphate transport system substrate-binding protein
MTKRLAARVLSVCAAMLMAGAALTGCSRPDAGGANATELNVKGSDTMVNLCAAWTEAFMKANPGKSVSVTGGGSGTGIAALINGTTDIAASSRPMKESELKQVEAGGAAAVEHILGLDGLAICVHKDNPLSEIKFEDVTRIYLGEVSNWSEIGGSDANIVVLSRDSSSGTYGFFREHVLGDKDYRKDALFMGSTAQIATELQRNAGGIGYLGLAYAEASDVKILPVVSPGGGATVTPTVETVQSGEYAVARPLYLYTRGVETGLAKEFLDFAASPEGQKIVLEVGYVPNKK